MFIQHVCTYISCRQKFQHSPPCLKCSLRGFAAVQRVTVAYIVFHFLRCCFDYSRRLLSVQCCLLALLCCKIRNLRNQIWMCMRVYIYMYTYVSIHIEGREKERKRERESERRACMCIYIYMAFLYYIPSWSILLKYIKLQYYIWVVFVCIYVCMYVCVRVCVCVCAYADVVRVACMTHKDRSSKAQKP